MLYSKNITPPGVFLFFLTLFFSLGLQYSKSQTTSYKQFWNEFAFTHPVSQKNAIELDLGSSFSNTPDERSRLSEITQLSLIFQFHHFLSAKWKLTFFTGYYSNTYVPEIGQREYPEWRFSAQAVYYFNKIKNVTTTRGRVEYRLIENTSGVFENVTRYRQMFKFTKPLNTNYIRGGTFFAFVSEEVFIKTPSNISGPDVFDRNMFTIGVGHAFTDDLQMDVAYTNEYIPREGGNIMNNALQFNLTLNNPFGYIERIFHPAPKP
jgi:hypothetical protein